MAILGAHLGTGSEGYIIDLKAIDHKWGIVGGGHFRHLGFLGKRVPGGKRLGDGNECAPEVLEVAFEMLLWPAKSND